MSSPAKKNHGRRGKGGCVVLGHGFFCWGGHQNNFFALRATSAVPPFYTIDIAEVQRPCGPGPVAMRKQAGGVWPQRRGRCSCRGCAGRIIH